MRIGEYEKTQSIRSKEAVLIKAAVNISVDQARRKARSPFSGKPRSLEFIVDTEPGPDDVAQARARLRRLREGLEQMNETSRRILLARRLDDISVAEIARRENMSIAAVEKQIARATVHLMKWIDGW